ncbi:hypothetical protein WJX74_010454 [Apatococcus lobatus]|uniref:Apyrase n=1 Tax=Apatococcus lobatus TaxID=904363 RepID=A0AAW1RQ68_9CHLO
MNIRACWALLQSQALLLTAIVSVALAGFELHQSWWTSPGYILVVDCGSTGTRLHAYQWQDKPSRLPLLRSISIKAARHKVPRRSGGKRAYERVETEPGIDSFLHDISGVKNKALGPLLDWAAAVVPPHLQAATPIFLLGTAGLRKMTSEPRQKLLAEAQSILTASPFRFENEWAEVITGEQEGLYGWIALNYLTGRLRAQPLSPAANESLDQPHPAAPSYPHEGPGSRKGPAGALDLGGSSLEITYPVQDQHNAQGPQANVSIAGVPYMLTTHAYPGLGLNDAFAASVAQLLAARSPQQQDDLPDAEGGLDNSPDQVIEEPSLPETPRHRIARHILAMQQADVRTGHLLAGQSGSHLRHLLVNSFPPSTEQQQQTQQFSPALGSSAADLIPHDLADAGEAVALERQHIGPASVSSAANPIQWDQRGFSRPYALRHKNPALPSLITLVGRPNWEACGKLAAAVVDDSPLCPNGSCIVADTIRQQRADFYALTGFYVVFHFLRLPSTASLDQLLLAGRRYCQEPWDSIPAARRQEIQAETYCFRAPFVADLLQRGLGLKPPRVRIGTGSEAWTLGAALAQGSAARLEDPAINAAFQPPAPTWVQAVWGVLLAGCLLWLAWLIWNRICIGMGRPPSSFEAARRVGVDRLIDALPLPAARLRSLQLSSVHEDQHLYHTGGTARVGSMPLPSIGPINVGSSHLHATAAPSSPGRSGFFWSPSTRAIGGSFNSNMHWLNSQRKRNMSQDNLELHGAEL